MSVLLFNNIKMIKNEYDLIVIWAGPAWYASWMYASRYWLDNLIIWAQPGGTLATSHKVENYPWTISASWKEIMDNLREHALINWTDIISENVESLNKITKWDKDFFEIKTSSDKVFNSKYIILATWTNHRHLWVTGEKEFFGKWVSYCATCDWMFFKNMDVVVVWWWNTALNQTLYLANICKKVYLVHRSEAFRGDNCWLEEIKRTSNIEMLTSDEVIEIAWDTLWMTWVKLKSWKQIDAQWIFIAIWFLPNTKLVDHLNIEKDSEWCLVTDKRQETSIKWIYAAWDITTNSNKFRQAITAAAEWCVATASIQEDILRYKSNS